MHRPDPTEASAMREYAVDAIEYQTDLLERIVQLLEASRVLVEPDYEASAIRYRKMYPGYDPTLIGEVIKPVVDAAYGIGDKHE